MLEARDVPAGDGRLRSDVVGDIELTDDGVLVIRRIHVTYRLQVEADADRDAIDRAHELHVSRCPVARSIGASIDITTELQLEEGE